MSDHRSHSDLSSQLSTKSRNAREVLSTPEEAVIVTDRCGGCKQTCYVTRAFRPLIDIYCYINMFFNS